MFQRLTCVCVCVMCDVCCIGTHDDTGQSQLNVDHNSQWHDATPCLLRARRRWIWTTRGHLHQVRRYCESTRVSVTFWQHSWHTVIILFLFCPSLLQLPLPSDNVANVFCGNLQSSTRSPSTNCCSHATSWYLLSTLCFKNVMSNFLQ